MLAAPWPMGFCLAIVAFMPNIWTMTLIVLAFFSAYYVYEPPYRGLYPTFSTCGWYDARRAFSTSCVDRHRVRARRRRLLFHVWHPGPFLLRRRGDDGGLRRADPARSGGTGRGHEGLPRSPKLRADELERVQGCPGGAPLLIANAAWEGTFAAMRTFVVLYHHARSRQPLSTSSAVLATVAVGYTWPPSSRGRSATASAWRG